MATPNDEIRALEQKAATRAAAAQNKLPSISTAAAAAEDDPSAATSPTVLLWGRATMEAHPDDIVLSPVISCETFGNDAVTSKQHTEDAVE